MKDKQNVHLERASVNWALEREKKKKNARLIADNQIIQIADFWHFDWKFPAVTVDYIVVGWLNERKHRIWSTKKRSQNKQ